MNAFLTGSRAYGTPHEKSDIDLVVLVSQPELELLASLQHDARDMEGHKESVDGAAEAYKGLTTTALRFGKLNLICVTEEADLAVWREGTDELVARKPVTRPEAVALFAAKRKALVVDRLESNPLDF